LNKVTAFVVDDEPVARAGLRAMLASFDWVEVIGEAADGQSAVKGIRELAPRLVFLDVQMPGLLGTDVLRQIEEPPYVIFTTAYSEHAVTAFELGAVDYLLKPFGPRRLAAAMERVRAAVGTTATADSVERMTDAMGGGPIDRLFVRVGASLVPVSVERISHLEADGDYVIIHVDGARHVLHLALSAIEARLDTKRFMRVHRAHVVNLDQVKSFKRDARGNLEASLADGTRVPVSRARAQQLKGIVRG
jgi:two-component system, LytTR family, response regulator